MCNVPWPSGGLRASGLGGLGEEGGDLVNFQDCKEAAAADREA